jgi:WD40 repeat protein
MIDPKLARLIHTGEAPGILYGCCLDPATGHCYGGGADGHVYRLATRVADGEKPLPEKAPAEKLWRHHDNYIAALVWHEGVVISAGYDGKLVWTRAESGEKLREVNAHEGWIRDLVFVGSDKLATAADDMRVKVWNLNTGEHIRTCEGHTAQTPEGYASALYAAAASADGKQIASADRIGQVNVWNAETGERLAQFRSSTFYTFDAEKRARAIGGIRSLSFSPDGKQLALGGIGQVSNVDGFVGPCRVEIWDWQAGKRVYLGTDKHQAILNHVEYLAESKLIIGAGGGDGGPILGFWDQAAESPVAKAKPKAHIQHFVYDPAAEQLIAAGLGGFQVWAFTPAPKEAKKSEKSDSK